MISLWLFLFLNLLFILNKYWHPPVFVVSPALHQDVLVVDDRISIQDPIDLDWIDLVNKGKNPDTCLYFHLEDNK